MTSRAAAKGLDERHACAGKQIIEMMEYELDSWGKNDYARRRGLAVGITIIRQPYVYLSLEDGAFSKAVDETLAASAARNAAKESKNVKV